ncbi:YitT family protein [Methanoculleus sp. Wushi-C6]|uniref:YitT family protein n=1 Tax=Methanoculleus caldifontis TaxID=2651577 RepID=A0ABU3WY29_9EURY|nr:DUF6198 family protein [Methanoculleus sp. Wushi-C6]MDV2480712.1 YitT family protein [Methanoculleus sp. Wushi-C6]
MTAGARLRRYALLIAGLFFMGLGISLVTKSYLGTSPISSVPYVLCLAFPVSFGTFTFLLGAFFLLLEILILRRDFQKIQVLQIFVGLILGVSVDIGMHLLFFVEPAAYAERIATLLAGCAVLAVGVYLEVSSNTFVHPADAVVKIIADKAGRNFGYTKIAFDTTLCCTAGAISLAAFGTLKGLGEGTIISALLVGYIIAAISAILVRFNIGRGPESARN